MMAEYLFIALAGGVTIDFLFGDPSNRYHPVAWLGRFIGFFVPKLKDNSNNSAKKERVKGLIFTTSLIITFGVVIHSIVFTTLHLLGAADVIVFSTIILKIAISIRGMEKHARIIMSALKRSDLENAQYNLSMIVRRNTKTLDEQHVISGIIECISESTVDGIVSPLFYYSFFGPAGAFIYRIINTLDSMLGYKDNYYQNIGWMSARLDTIANYIPARITAFLMVISAGIIGADWKNSLQILQRDHNKTFSPNAGYPMATMAGALRIKLEKIGHYSLGEKYEPSSVEKCKAAISIMKLTTILFCVIFSTPLIAILYLAGWWGVLFGI